MLLLYVRRSFSHLPELRQIEGLIYVHPHFVDSNDLFTGFVNIFKRGDVAIQARVIRFLKRWIELDANAFNDCGAGLGLQLARLREQLEKTKSPYLSFLDQTIQVRFVESCPFKIVQRIAENEEWPVRRVPLPSSPSHEAYSILGAS